MATTALRRKKQTLTKFMLLVLLLMGYFVYLSYEYDLVTGGVAALLTWSFFVMCTPIADAGFLLDFPLRLLFGIRMVLSELAVWTIAISLNVISFLLWPGYYDTTIMTRILHRILTTPDPYWGIILLSAAGTFLSIRFGDGLMDAITNRDRHILNSRKFQHGVVLILCFILVTISYCVLIISLGLAGQYLDD